MDDVDFHASATARTETRATREGLSEGRPRPWAVKPGALAAIPSDRCRSFWGDQTIPRAEGRAQLKEGTMDEKDDERNGTPELRARQAQLDHLSAALADLRAHTLPAETRDRLGGFRDWAGAQLLNARVAAEQVRFAEQRAARLMDHAGTVVEIFATNFAGAVVDKLPATLPLLGALLELPGRIPLTPKAAGGEATLAEMLKERDELRGRLAATETALCDAVDSGICAPPIDNWRDYCAAMLRTLRGDQAERVPPTPHTEGCDCPDCTGAR